MRYGLSIQDFYREQNQKMLNSYNFGYKDNLP